MKPISQAFIFIFSLVSVFYSCKEEDRTLSNSENQKRIRLHILGTVQDGGAPHMGCTKPCCADLYEHPDPSKKVVSLGLVDPFHQQRYLFDATPDISSQYQQLMSANPDPNNAKFSGVFLTHAHIGHYTGLMHFGREVMGAKNIPVYCGPRMGDFLKNSGPWSQLVELKNIELRDLTSSGDTLKLNDSLGVVPLLVPHRDEYSETYGFVIVGPRKSALFIPDINKWETWERSLVEEIKKVNRVYIDATFYDSTEVGNRTMSEIPHPFVVETMDLLKDLPLWQKRKVHFIHLNHTNPLLNPKSFEYQNVIHRGFNVAKYGDTYRL